MTRAREPITFSAVAARAGVSREYLHRKPDLADKIRSARSSPTPRPAVTADAASVSVIRALREHIRRLEAEHALEVRGLHADNEALRRQLQHTLGALLDAGGSQPEPSPQRP